MEDAHILELHQGVLHATRGGRPEGTVRLRPRPGDLGRRIDTPWSYYGFLSLPQVRTLHAGLAKMREDDPSLGGEGFMGGFLDELMGWLEVVVSAEQDLWFDCR